MVPKNSGFNFIRDGISKIAKTGSEIINLRAEDIPFILERLPDNGKRFVGITGEDLWQNYALGNSATDLEVKRKLEWADERALFLKPTLCLLGKKGAKIKTGKEISVAINAKYSLLAGKFLSKYEDRGVKFNKIVINGSVETTFAIGLADMVIDIVYSGKTFREQNLAILENIFSSNIVVLGKKGGKNENL
ncbi:MAG: hypothetical protein ABID38_01485 [Candidatus Diapherotrites archaeon]